MTTESLRQVGLQEVRKNWGWFLGLGMLLVLLGTIAIGRSCLLTIASVVFFGWLMIFGGALEVVHAFWKERGWSGFFLDLFAGILHVVIGFLIVSNPAASALTLTLLIAMFLMVGGAFRIATSLAVRHANWVWVLLQGLVNLLLGALIWQQWPVSGLWVIGLFLGIEMILNGWSLVMLGLSARGLPAGSEAAPAAAQ